ncbi:MAG: chromate resistance protein [Chloroflexi bacterium]|nr:MAG: chromate resistance protein [Chloroflexota bacterium]
MKWITRERPRVDRVACPWLIEKFVDKDAVFIYVPADQVMTEARRQNATPYDVKDVELGHRGAECSFDAFVRKYGLEKDPAMSYMAKVIRGADTADKTLTPESIGLERLGCAVFRPNTTSRRVFFVPEGSAQPASTGVPRC